MSSPILIVKALTFLSGFGSGMCSCKHSYAWNADACYNVTVLCGTNQGCFVHCCYRAFTKNLIGVAHWNTGDSCSPYRSKILFSNRSLCLNKFLKLQFCFQITTWYKHFLAIFANSLYLRMPIFYLHRSKSNGNMAYYTQEFKHAQEFLSRENDIGSYLNKSLDQAAGSYNEQMQRATWNNHCCPDCEAIPLNLIPAWGTGVSLITLQPFLQLEPVPAEAHTITTLHFSI